MLYYPLMPGPTPEPYYNHEAMAPLIEKDMHLAMDTLLPADRAACRKLINDFCEAANDPLKAERLCHYNEDNTTPIPAGYTSYSLVLPEGSVEIRRQYYQTLSDGMKQQHYISVSSDTFNLTFVKSEILVPYLFTAIHTSKIFSSLTAPHLEEVNKDGREQQ